VRTDLFAESKAPAPDRELVARDVQTGEFGTSNGVPGGLPRIGAPASIGGFDQTAAQRGSATKRSNTSPAAVGFGTPAPAQGAKRVRSERAPVRSAEFAQAVGPPEAQRPKPAVSASPVIPVEIVSKPRPDYTDEARQKRLEGEVVLEVLFTAGGRSQVVRVVQGLGSGLDEAAVAAAEKIVFKPARRDGEAIDYTAVVRIIFQLA
jgi:TonB family protein